MDKRSLHLTPTFSVGFYERWTLKGFIKVHLHEKYKRNDKQPKFWPHQLIFHIMSGIQKCICASLWGMRNMYKDGLLYQITSFYGTCMIYTVKSTTISFLGCIWFRFLPHIFFPPPKKYCRNGCHISFKFAPSFDCIIFCLAICCWWSCSHLIGEVHMSCQPQWGGGGPSGS